jgi:tetratricopeptide (TPR) repeat protein
VALFGKKSPSNASGLDTFAGDPVQAYQAAKRAKKTPPPEVILGMAHAYMSDGDVPHAIECFLEVTDVFIKQEAWSAAKRTLGMSLRAWGRAQPTEAMVMRRLAIALGEEDFREGVRQLGYLDLVLSAQDHATINRLIRLCDQAVPPYEVEFKLADTLRRVGREAVATQRLEMVLTRARRERSAAYIQKTQQLLEGLADTGQETVEDTLVGFLGARSYEADNPFVAPAERELDAIEEARPATKPRFQVVTPEAARAEQAAPRPATETPFASQDDMPTFLPEPTSPATLPGGRPTEVVIDVTIEEDPVIEIPAPAPAPAAEPTPPRAPLTPPSRLQIPLPTARPEADERTPGGRVVAYARAGQYALSDDDWIATRQLVKEALDAQRDALSAASQYEIGAAFMQMGLYPEAIEALTQAMQHDTTREQAAELLLRSHVANDAPNKAIAFGAMLLGTMSDMFSTGGTANLSFWMGQASEALEDVGTALSWYQKALRAVPDHAGALQRQRILTEAAAS